MTIKDVLRESANGSIANGKAPDDLTGRWKKASRPSEAAQGGGGPEHKNVRLSVSLDRIAAYTVILVLMVTVVVFTLHAGAQAPGKTTAASAASRPAAKRLAAAVPHAQKTADLSTEADINGWRRWENASAADDLRITGAAGGQYLAGIYQKTGSIAKLWMQSLPDKATTADLMSYGSVRQLVTADGTRPIQATLIHRFKRTCLIFAVSGLKSGQPFEIISKDGFVAQSPYTISWISKHSVVTVGADTVAIRDAFAAQASALFQ